jgi:AcrR family transcriptional regulator
MARPLSPDRLEQLVAAATEVFGTKGYRRTQMAQIAAAAGVSAGSLYSYVESKEALFDLVLRRGIDGDHRAVELPVPTVRSEETAAWLSERLDFRDFPILEVALRRRRAKDAAAELGDVVTEIYDVLLRMRGAIEVLDHSSPELPEVTKVFLQVRRDLFARMGRYVRSRVRAKQFRPLLDPEATARLILETTYWAAARRRRDRDEVSMGDEAARSSLRELVVNALVPEQAEAKGKGRQTR